MVLFVGPRSLAYKNLKSDRKNSWTQIYSSFIENINRADKPKISSAAAEGDGKGEIYNVMFSELESS